MFENIIYILATGSLFIGSLLTFKKEIPDYFYMTGTSLFLIKSIISFIENIKKKKKKRNLFYEDII
tara:strand:+ start:316 stop:513 length:198 start_codon:yes stop_codon:yes gene_type:complete